MAYIALSRRWRPQKFDDVVGQAHVVRTLQNVLRSGKVHHAYLFSGPRGVGKTTMARLFAKALNCPNRGDSPEPCNDCDSCRDIAASRSLDVREIDAASNNGVDDVRELRENVKIGTVSSRYRVYIVDEAHMLSMPAWNALLKTLEEPPSHVIFVFASTQKDRFPATILSRCQQFEFRRMTHEEIVGRLHVLAATDDLRIEDQGLELIAAQSDGCLRDAQSTLEQVVAYADGPVSEDDVSRILGYGSASTMDALKNALVDRDMGAAISAATELSDQGAEPSQCLRLLLTFFHTLMRLKVDPGLSRSVSSSTTALEQMRAVAERMAVERIQWTLRLLMRAERDIKLLQHDAFNFELALIDVCRVEDGIPLEQVLSRLEALRSDVDAVVSGAGLSDVVEPTVDETPAVYDDLPVTAAGLEPPSDDASEPAPELTAESMAQMWRLVCDNVVKDSAPLAGHLGKATPTFRDGTLWLGFQSGVALNAVKKKLPVVQQAIKGVLGRRIAVKLEEDSDAAPPTITLNESRATEEERHEQEQLVLQIFNGTIEDKLQH